MAGLAAARRLRQENITVKILEARDRYGGRVYSDDRLGWLIDRGAAWIHGAEGNPMTALAQEFHVAMEEVNFSRFYVFDRIGQRIPATEIEQFNDELENKLNQAQAWALQAQQDCSLAAAFSHFLPMDTLSFRQQDLFKRKLGFFEGYIGASYEKLSARYWNHEKTLPGGNYFLKHSYKPIIDALAQGCDLQLNTIVQVIQEKDQSVEVLTNRGRFQADVVIVTVPLTLLQKKTIQFDPPLSANKDQAIARLGMGLLNIAAFKFPTVFWPQDAQALFFSSFDALSFPTFINFYQFNQQPILLAYAGGEKALKIEALSDQEVMVKLMNDFKRQYGNQVPDPIDYFITRWSQDPFSQGSYSYIPVGASVEDRETLAQPASKRILFAGEATHRDYPATTHGAYWSGIREAERILLSFPYKGYSAR